jgi:glutathione S-transferase
LAQAIDYARPMKLTYFPVRGRIEPVRLLLELEGRPYEFVGIPVEAWRAGGEKQRFADVTPFAQLPTFEDGALKLCQSQAILRHLGRGLERAGSTSEEVARVDEIVETSRDIFFDVFLLFWDPGFHDKRAASRDAMAKKLAGLRAHFKRVTPDGVHWATRERSSIADVSMSYALETMLSLHPGLVEEHPELDRSMRAFFAEPGVKAYVTSERRPRTWTVAMATFGGKPEETHHW